MKRFAAMLLVVAMAFACLFAFAGCGNNDKGNTTKGSADGSETGVASGTFKLGGIGPLTGDAAIYGTAVMNGAQIAVDEINAKNGNVKFEFKSADDVSDAETSTNAYNSLLDWGMQILIGRSRYHRSGYRGFFTYIQRQSFCFDPVRILHRRYQRQG